MVRLHCPTLRQIQISRQTQIPTRMHSSRMRTVRCSGRRGGVFPGVSDQGVSVRGLSNKGEGVSAQGVYPSMHWAGGCLPQCMLGYTRPHLWTEFLTHACENITTLRTVIINLHRTQWESVLISVSVQCKNLHTILCNQFSIRLCISLGVGQCEHNKKVFNYTGSCLQRVKGCKRKARHKWVLVVTELFNIAVDDIQAKKSGRYSRVLVITELVLSGTSVFL